MDRPAHDRFHARLFRSRGKGRELQPEDLARIEPRDDELLWVDLRDPSEALLRSVMDALQWPDRAQAELADPRTTPMLGKTRERFWLTAVAVSHGDGLALEGQLLALAAAPNLVVSLHRDEIAFIDELRQREEGDSDIGALGAESFVAALLDWQLSTYFDAVADFEAAVERLENDILTENPRDCLSELRRLRRAASRLRRMLAPHRGVFDALSRPDFRPSEEGTADRHFQALAGRFQRAMDTVEDARDLVMGSFELLNGQVGLVTNRTVRTLTFVTVVTGVLAVLAGMLGMNFDAPFFKTQTAGFAVAAGAMLLIAGIAAWIGKRKSWY